MLPKTMDLHQNNDHNSARNNNRNNRNNHLDGNADQRSPYFRMARAAPPAQRPATVNLDNPLNPVINYYNSTTQSRYEATAHKEPAATLVDANLLPSSIRIQPTSDAVTDTLQPSPVTTRQQAAPAQPALPYIPGPASIASQVPSANGLRLLRELRRRQDLNFRQNSPTPKPHKPVLESRKQNRATAQNSSDLSVHSDADFSSDIQKRAKKVKRSRKRRSSSESSAAATDVLVRHANSARVPAQKRRRQQNPFRSSDDNDSSFEAGDDANERANKFSSRKEAPAKSSCRRSSSKYTTKVSTADEEAARALRNKRKNDSRPLAGSHLGVNEDGIPMLKIQSTPVPATWQEAGPADRMMFRWRALGRSWGEVRNEWQRITGTLPGFSTLSVRNIKLQSNLSQGNSADDTLLIKAKREAEKELKNEIWERVAEKIKAAGRTEYSLGNLARRYEALERSGFDLSTATTRVATATATAVTTASIAPTAPTIVAKNRPDADEVEENEFTAIDRNLAGLDCDDDDDDDDDEVEEDDSATEVEGNVQQAILAGLKVPGKFKTNTKNKTSVFELPKGKAGSVDISILDYGSTSEDD